MVLRALPNALGRDGERQFLTGFGFLACLSGVGVAAVGAVLGRLLDRRAVPVLNALILSIALIAGAWSTWRFHPLQFSYYNGLIGGLSGASRVGMEPTFYWDAMTPDVRDWLNAHTEPGRSVAFDLPAVTFEYLHRWGLLRPSPLAVRGQGPRWYIVMNRPGHLEYPEKRLGQFLIDHVPPAFVKTLGVAPDVPLVLVFPGEDAFAANLILKRPAGERPALPPTPPRP